LPLVGALQSSIKLAHTTDVKNEKRMLQFEKEKHAVTLVQKWFETNYGKEVPTYEKIGLQATQEICWNSLSLCQEEI
jgi:hypothetical protein